jgi:hypothetical protein
MGGHVCVCVARKFCKKWVLCGDGRMLSLLCAVQCVRVCESVCARVCVHNCADCWCFSSVRRAVFGLSSCIRGPPGQLLQAMPRVEQIAKGASSLGKNPSEPGGPLQFAQQSTGDGDVKRGR